LFGGVSGLPLGVSLVGSLMIRSLEAAGVAKAASVAVVFVHRLGTAWYALFLGVLSFWLWRSRLARLLGRRSAGHFDEIAHTYQEQIPTHTRDRLLARKSQLTEDVLQKLGIQRPAAGLDLGCGQGWYLAEFARAGYRMSGIDASGGQLRQAARHLRESGLASQGVVLAQADAQALPFPDGAFDFVYSVNAFHHLPSVAAQTRAFRETERVLRPGGTFVLHEMNTQNPVFRLYMGYLFPLLKQIDEGTEHWILPSALPAVPRGTWAPEIRYFTFMPDFIPRALERVLGRMERVLERSAMRRYSAHYQACWVKDRGPTGA
jgi:ubiquinone/menaquinone biosynthesis C-methylase UbiE